MVLSIVCVFLNYIIVVNVFYSLHGIVLATLLLIINYFHILRAEKDRRHQFWESLFLGWLTITNLGKGKTASLYRLVTTLFWTVAHTLTLVFILVVCNTDPGLAVIGQYIDWSKLALVQDLSTLNILLVSTLCLGWLSLVLDVITAAVKNHYKDKNRNTEDQEEASFWDGAILLEGLKYQKCCS